MENQIKPEDVATSLSVMILKNGQALFTMPDDTVKALGLLELAKYQVYKNIDQRERENESRLVTPPLIRSA